MGIRDVSVGGRRHKFESVSSRDVWVSVKFWTSGEDPGFQGGGGEDTGVELGETI